MIALHVSIVKMFFFFRFVFFRSHVLLIKLFSPFLCVSPNLSLTRWAPVSRAWAKRAGVFCLNRFVFRFVSFRFGWYLSFTVSFFLYKVCVQSFLFLPFLSSVINFALHLCWIICIEVCLLFVFGFIFPFRFSLGLRMWSVIAFSLGTAKQSTQNLHDNTQTHKRKQKGQQQAREGTAEMGKVN